MRHDQSGDGTLDDLLARFFYVPHQTPGTGCPMLVAGPLVAGWSTVAAAPLRKLSRAGRAGRSG
jgi:hypothetical protein